jgi:ribosomal protein S1
VELEEGVVGFLPGSLAGVARGEPLGTAYKPGAAVELQVKEVDPEKRHVTLMVSNVAAEEEKSEFNAFMKRQGVVPQKLGSFGELLQKALDKKK